MYSPEYIANLFAGYLRDNKADAKHVFRVITWLGLLSLAIDKVKISWHRPTSRQLVFEANVAIGGSPTSRYKIRYNHSIPMRGGLEIVKVDTSRGQAELGVVAAFASLYDVERFYQLCVIRGWEFDAILSAYNNSRPVARVEEAA